MAELLALAVWQVSKWSRHLDGGFAENATGSNWPAALIGILNLNGSSMMAKEPFNSIRITALAAYPVA